MTGSLRVEGIMHGGEPIVEVRTDALDLETRTRANSEIELEPGRYVVSVAMPDGTKPTEVVEVEEGRKTKVSLADVSQVEFLRADEVGALFVERAPERRSRFPLLARLADLGRPSLYTRVSHAGMHEFPELPGEPAPQVVHSSQAHGETELRLAIEPPSSLSIAQFGLGKAIPTNVMLPLHDQAHNARCNLVVTYDRSGDVDPVAVPTGSPEIDLIAGYLRTGQLEAAGEVAREAERLLRGKVTNPIAAALAGYALLRLGETKRLHDWPENLANWFPWLPDGAVIVGEQAARAGDEKRAVHWFATTLDRGYPMFSDGLSLLASRLREHLHADHLPEPLRQREQAVRRLIRMVPFVDFGQLVVTFRGLDVDDPAGSQEPLPKRPRDWKALRRI